MVTLLLLLNLRGRRANDTHETVRGSAAGAIHYRGWHRYSLCGEPMGPVKWPTGPEATCLRCRWIAGDT